jgi:hypothetical protein
MAHIHFTGRLEARAEEDRCASRNAFYVRHIGCRLQRGFIEADHKRSPELRRLHNPLTLQGFVG